MTDRLEQVEIKLAFLEESNAQLSDVVLRQQREIDALTRRLEVLMERLVAVQQAPTAYTLEDEKPPHY
jgi:SlyX protein